MFILRCESWEDTNHIRTHKGYETGTVLGVERNEGQARDE